MRIAVVGSRVYPHLGAVRRFVFEQERDTVIVSGGARGVDQTAVNTAMRYRMPYEVYRAQWKLYDLAAGPIRNRIIANCSDRIVAFWDGSSTGTKDIIDYANSIGKPVSVVGA